MKTRTEDLAYENGLKLVDVTQGMNGYPSGLYKAVSGFESFEDAEDFAKQVRGEVVDLCKRDGHQFWSNCGRVWQEWKLTAEDYGDDYECVTDWEDWWEDEKEILSETMKELETPDDLTILTDRVWKIYNEINNLGDNEQILLCRGEYYDTIPIKTTRYHIDVYERMIAVVDHETDEDEREEDDED